MQRLIVATGVCCALSAALVWADDKKDAGKVVGTWSVTAEEKDGKQQTAEGIKDKQVKITANYVRLQLADILKDEDLSKFVL